MNLKVLAEGVEDIEQLIYLEQHGCDEVQGYYYSKPIPADELEVLCKKEAAGK
jgi:EAL domain-containing protein (putative c-di-GMP-specific phosphodiesterase class I)